MEGAQVAQVLGLEDDGREGGAEPGGGRHGWGWHSGVGGWSYQRRLISTGVDTRSLGRAMSTLAECCRAPCALSPPCGASQRVRRGGRPAAGHYTPAMDRRSALVLLAVFGAGVFLAGLELMITAVALPSILADLVDANGTTAWLELRKASWIVNGYLLVYILVMPLAGRLADLWGARRLFLAALAVFTVGSVLAGAAQDLDQLIAARVVQAVGRRRAGAGRDGRGRAPVRGPRPGPGAGRDRRPDLPGHGRRAVPGGRHPGRLPSSTRRSSARVSPTEPAAAVLSPGLALDLLRQRARGHRGHGPRLGGLGRLGDAPSSGPGGPARGGPVRAGPGRRAAGPDPAGHRDRGRHGPRSGRRDRRPVAGRRAGHAAGHRPGPALERPVPGRAPVPERPVQRRRPGLAADRLRLRHGHHRRGRVRRPGPVRRSGRAAGGPRRAGRGDGHRRARWRACWCGPSATGW